MRQEQPRGTGDALRSCRDHLRSETFLTLNGDDLYGAADLAALARRPAGVLVHPVDEPRQFGIAFLKPDGTLEKLVEKPDLDGRRPANTGAYVFPRDGVRHRTDAVAARRVRDHGLRDGPGGKAAGESSATFWLPIGTVEVWQEAQAGGPGRGAEGAVASRTGLSVQRPARSLHRRQQAARTDRPVPASRSRCSVRSRPSGRTCSRTLR